MKRRAVLTALLLVGGCSADRPDAGTSAVTATAATTRATPASTDTGVTTTLTTAPASTVTGATTTLATTPAATTTTVGSEPPQATARLLAAISGPTDLAWRAGDDHLYVTEQDGLVAAIDAAGTATAVLDMRQRTAARGERGLLGVALHPAQPLAYLDYTDTAGNTVIDEYAVAADGTFDPASRRQLLTVDQPYANHNGGEVVFGPDGYLYIGMGDGGGGGDPQRRAMDLADLLGKVLRIDPLAADDRPYSVPADNPFVAQDGARPEIWSYGLRNPWRMSFDRQTLDLWIADVGQGDWEEIDVARAADGGGRGVNFGWSAFEGTHRYNDDVSPDGVTMPVYEYSHDSGACSISGGVLYRGAAIPALQGWYVYADYCSGEVHAVRPDGSGDTLLTRLALVSAVTEGPDAELYVLSLSDGVFQLVPG